MKKTLLSIFAASLFSVTASFGQCSPDPAYANSDFGLFPAVIPFVQACEGCGDAIRFVDFVTFTDTVITGIPIVGTVTIHIDAFKITTVDGVPAGLTIGSDVDADSTAEAPYGMWLNGGTTPNQTGVQGCVYISGSEATWMGLLGGGPNSDGIYPLTINVDARIGETVPDASVIVPNGAWLSSVDTSLGGGEFVVDDYYLEVVAGSVGIRGYNQEQFSILENYPNPVEGITSIRFNAPIAMNNLTFSVYSILGNEVFSEQVSAKYGMNKFEFDASNLSSGMYIYSLSDGTSVSTRKMTVK
jgi:hypothetical protein